jgi:prevent-host-death family protein
MSQVKFSEDVRTITDLKMQTAEVMEHVRRSRRPVLLTRRGKGVAVLVELETYERLVDRAAFVEAVDEGARAAAAGDLHPHREAEKILKRFGE